MKQAMHAGADPAPPLRWLSQLDKYRRLADARRAMAKTKTSKEVPTELGGLSKMLSRLSRKRQEVIRPVLESPREFVLLSVRSMAERLRSDPATTVRIVQGMGFPSYRDFQKFLHELSVARATSLDLMQAGSQRDASIPSHVREAFEQEGRNLQALRNSLDFARLESLAARIHRAKRILLIGGDLAESLVTYFEYHLGLLGFCVLRATTPGRTAHFSRMFGRGDLVFAISFRRGLRQTVEGLQQAKDHGAYCVGITDTFLSPIARSADESILASVETPSFGASYVAPIALLNVILVACANYRRARTLKLLQDVDKEQRLGFRWYE